MLVTIVTELTYQFPAQGFINAIRTDRKVLVRGVPRCLRVTAAGSGISQRVLVAQTQAPYNQLSVPLFEISFTLP